MLSLGMFALPARAAAGDTYGHGKSDKKETRAAKSAKPAKGNQPGKGNAHKARAETHRAREVSNVVVIDQDGPRRVVHEFFTRETLPPGLAKRESLPPGPSKQLREKGRLPPGLQKRLTPVPPALGSRLPAVPAHYSCYFAGRDLVIVDTRTHRIVSVIRDILP
jgi:hypothetical protein